MAFRRIRDLREDADLTQTELSKHLNLTKRSYSHYENGTKNITPDVIISIADFYDVSIDYLFERTDNKKVNR